MTKNAGDESADLERLIGAMRDDITKLTEALTEVFAAKAAGAADAAKEGFEDVLGRGRAAADRIKGEAEEAAESIHRRIEERPLTSILIALVLGFVAGTMTRR